MPIGPQSVVISGNSLYEKLIKFLELIKALELRTSPISRQEGWYLVWRLKRNAT
jgi:hypothetical protein